MLAVVVHQRVIQRIDAAEIFRVEGVLAADARRRLGAEIGSEQAEDRAQD